MDTEKKYNEALKKARMYRDNAKAVEDYSAVARYENIFPELRKEEKPLTPFQQCLNCILRGAYYAEVPDEKVNEFIVNIVRTRTDELIKLAKIHEYTDCQLHESKDERMRKLIIDRVRSAEEMTEGLRELLLSYLEKQKEHSMSAEEVLTKAGLKPYKDGNKWCILAGDNIQEGICGFGDTIDEALYQFLMEVLEVQKEQKHAPDDLQKSFEAGQASIIDNPEQYGLCKNPAWSEGDENKLNHILEIVHIASGREVSVDEKEELESFLKSLRPCPYWKPSEEQIDALKEVMETYKGFEEYDAMKSLYNDLNKL